MPDHKHCKIQNENTKATVSISIQRHLMRGTSSPCLSRANFYITLRHI